MMTMRMEEEEEEAAQESIYGLEDSSAYSGRPCLLLIKNPKR
jgi:hypothetical protein